METIGLRHCRVLGWEDLRLRELELSPASETRIAAGALAFVQRLYVRAKQQRVRETPRAGESL